MKIVFLDGYTANLGDLNWSEFEALGEFTVYDRTEPENIIERISDAEYVFTNKCIIDKKVIDSCPNIKWIGVTATGYNVVDIDYAREKGIPVTNAPAYSSDVVAEYSYGLLLQLCHSIKDHSDRVHKGKWFDSPDFCFCDFPQMELLGKTMGIIGFGNIGRRSAKIADAFGMKVLIFSNYPDKSFESDNVKFTDLNTLIESSDVINLHCKLTEANKGFINAEIIGKMKKGAMIINTARGPLVNEKDLAGALKTGKLGGAALDVLSVEPPNRDNPLIGIENCIITPHVAWASKESRSRLLTIVSNNLKEFLKGNLVNCVNGL
ncbi:D-2-hydroxyacid dehydrogenase [Anaerovorax odorimutans]|uniref:D-2-hydroxyacid dehydrogenase n=1 Tax=Anaerovorax odorimutans TaxID=109327 RepID=UPI00041BBA8D|nr:D-2-hydroxyacid dehydrogenase [Anaerovorax odorimutans]